MKTFNMTYALATCLFIVGCAHNPVYQTQKKSDITSRQYYLPKAILNIKIERKADDDSLVDITITSKNVADTRQPLYLYRDHSLWYDDKYFIQTDSNGFLKGINTTNTFKGGEIVKAIGQIAGTAAQLAAMDMSQQTCSKKKFVLEVEIDPYEETSQEIMEKFLNGKCITIKYDPPKESVVNVPDGGQAGILYRSITFLLVTISNADNSSSKSVYVPVPDMTKVQIFTVDRGNFVNREAKLTFENGVLTQDETTYPSEILGFLSLPLELLNGISQAITGRFGAKTTSLNNEKAYLEALKQRDDALQQRNDALNKSFENKAQ